MRIGIEFDKVSLGGGERILYMLASSFAQRGHDVVIFTWNKQWEDPEKIPFQHQLCVLNHTPYLGKGLSSLVELNKEVKKRNVDCLISFLNTTTRVFIGAARLNKIPAITSLRVEPVFDTFIKKILKFIIYSCDGTVFQTNTVRNSFKGRIYRNSVVIHNPIMDDNLPFSNSEDYRKEIVGIGRLTEQKNFALLVDAFAELNPEGYTLKIYGEGHLKDDLSKQIEHYGMSDKIKLMGHVDRVVDHIAKADIFVLSSDWEGMPNALMESMAMGLACVATDVATGGCRDLIQEGENGLLVPVGDKVALREALRRIIENDELKKKLKINAQTIRQTHSKDTIIPQWISFIEECISKKRRQ